MRNAVLVIAIAACSDSARVDALELRIAKLEHAQAMAFPTEIEEPVEQRLDRVSLACERATRLAFERINKLARAMHVRIDPVNPDFPVDTGITDPFSGEPVMGKRKLGGTP